MDKLTWVDGTLKPFKAGANMQPLHSLTRLFLAAVGGGGEASLQESLPSAGPGEEADGAESQASSV